MRLPLLIFLFAPLFIQGQSIEVEYDKNRDFSRYKSFSFGESEITTPKDQRQAGDSSVLEWIQKAITEELTEKGLEKKDSLGDLVVSYVVGSLAKSDVSSLGPLGVSPTDNSQVLFRDFRMGSIIIDLNDRSNFLVWRVNATTTAASGNASTNTPRMIDEVVSAGFKKFSIKPKKTKKK